MDKHKNVEDIYPLSPMQQGILFHSLLAPDAGVYVPQVCITLNGLTDVTAFQRAWQEVLHRHPILRTAFRWERRDQPFQVVYRNVELLWEQQDWQEFSSLQQHQELENFLESDRQRSFDLKTPPLFRLTLIKLAATRYQLIWTQHHLILDGWSAGLVLKEVVALYNSELGVRKSEDWQNSRPYADYIAWLGQQDLSVAQAFWQKQLQGFTTPNFLQVEQIQTSVQPDWVEQQVSLPASVTTTLKSLAQDHQFTLNTLIQGAFAILLCRYCNEDDIIFGATTSGRPATLTGSESMVGLFINTLPVRVQVSEQALLIPWLQKLQAQQAEALQYEHTPLFDIQSWSEIPRGAALFEHILVFENYPVDASLLQSQAGLKIEQVRSQEWTSFPLTVLVSVATLTIKVKCDRHRFNDSTITCLLAHFQILLESIAKNPQQHLRELSILTPKEQQLLTKWNWTQAEYSTNQCIHELFEAQVERTPDAIAVVFADQQLTYRELDTQANQLADYLRNIGVKPEVLVGICLERSLEMVISILAILKAGGAYVPLEPRLPQERLDFMLAAQVSVLIRKSEVLILNSEFLTPNSEFTPSSDNSIYVIYTSGSTGKPKGVVNTHRGLINRLSWMQQAYKLTVGDRVLQKTPFSFDVSVWEFFWTLLNGACLVIAQPGGHQDSSYLVQVIIQEQITTLHFVPSMLQAFLEEPGLESCSLKRVICSGEALSVDLQNRFFERLNAQLHNLYGPTEAAIDVTCFECERLQATNNTVKSLPNSDFLIPNFSVPIGRPIDNTQTYILDSNQRQVPIGVAGELHIAGDGIARGYLNQPDLTAERFIPNPFNNSKFNRLYKTGDRARYLEDGNIQFLGRIDNQVKIRGFRIELGEIEAILSQHPEIQTAAVIAKEYQSSDRRLVAYLVPVASNFQIHNSELRSFLETKLPDYMIPFTFVVLESLPLTPNGKLDRRVLTLGTVDVESRSGVPPRNNTEEIIAAIWTEILKLEKVGVHDNFFELGGNSLLATRINSRLRQAFQLELPLRSLFEKPTIATLAEHIQTLQITIQQLQSPVATTRGRKEIEL